MQLRKLWIHNGLYFSLRVWFDAEAAQQHLTTNGAVTPEASVGGGGGCTAAPFLGAHRHLAAVPRSLQRPAEPRNGVQLALQALRPCPAAGGRCRQRREESGAAAGLAPPPPFARPGPAGVLQRAGPGALVPRVFAQHLAAPSPSLPFRPPRRLMCPRVNLFLRVSALDPSHVVSFSPSEQPPV